MMTGPSRNRRRRGRRGQRSRPEEPQGNEQASQEEQAPAHQVRMEEPRREERQARDSRRGRDAAQDQGDRAGGVGRKRTRGKRRPTRRPVINAMPTEVLKEDVRDIRPAGTIILRKVGELETSDGMTFGCPMLTRTRLGMPFAQGQRVPRCSMGWALHNEEEALLCMRTPNLRDCWQAHPEREVALRATGEEENAAD
ncbi:MAG TPA: hypothetical protein VD789_05430 [Thermomicrobiales bacterium]|nr:hypothetical protein [Thermomicrobiales bacterium]